MHFPSFNFSNFVSLISGNPFFLKTSSFASISISGVAKSGKRMSSFQYQSLRGTSMAGLSDFTHHKPSSFGTAKSFLCALQIFLIP